MPGLTSPGPRSNTDPRPAAVPTDARASGRRRHLAQAVTGVVLVVVSRLLVADAAVPAWEADLFGAVNGLPGALRWVVWPVMQLGGVWMYAVGGAGVYALTRRVRPALAAAVAVVAGWLAANLVKELVERGRPEQVLDGVHVRDGTADGPGYVSGHTTVAFALATVVTAVLPGRWRWVPLPVAAAVGIGRVYSGVHLPLDVVGGAGLGTLCGLAALIALGATHHARQG